VDGLQTNNRDPGRKKESRSREGIQIQRGIPDKKQGISTTISILD
jgi:hypothetical protein